jgi:hypothetical protein
MAARHETRLAVRRPLLWAMVAVTGLSQAAEQGNPTGPPPRAPANLYAFSGNWQNDVFVPAIAAKDAIPFDAAHERVRAGLEATRASGQTIEGNEPLCVPNGPVMGMNFNLLIFADAGRLTVMINRLTRLIDIDQDHPSGGPVFDTFSGEAVGHWQGDALVVDTIGVSPVAEIDWGVRSSGRMHLTESWRLASPTKLEIATVVEDTGALTVPWKFTRHYTRRPLPTAVDVGYCVSSLDRTRDKDTGKQGFDLTPPKEGYVPAGADR